MTTCFLPQCNKEVGPFIKHWYNGPKACCFNHIQQVYDVMNEEWTQCSHEFDDAEEFTLWEPNG